MVLRIRLSRPSTRRHSPLYNIVLTRARTARDSTPLEVLGTYNPTPQTPLSIATSTQSQKTPIDNTRRYKDVKLDITRTRYWLGVGAKASEPVERLLALIGLVEGRKEGK